MTSTSRSTLTLSVSDPTVEQHATLAQDAVTALIGLWLIGVPFAVSLGVAVYDLDRGAGGRNLRASSLRGTEPCTSDCFWLAPGSPGSAVPGGCAGTGTCHLVTDGGSSASVFSRSED